jgi:hypothetical protein
MQLVGAIWGGKYHFHIHDETCVHWMRSTFVYKKVAPSRWQHPYLHLPQQLCSMADVMHVFKFTTILTRKTAYISLTPGFFKLYNYPQLQFFSDISNARQYC